MLIPVNSKFNFSDPMAFIHNINANGAYFLIINSIKKLFYIRFGQLGTSQK